jgi:GTP-binding protein EngB required for normal cell division
MDDAREDGRLNPSQRQHLLSSCQYADKLLSEIEAVLSASLSKSPFPKFRPDISPSQAKIVQDYISRIRAQVLRILEGQGVPIPSASIGSVHSIRVTLGFTDIAFDECRPKRMAGYGEVPEGLRTEISGLVDELQGIIGRLDRYLEQGLSADMQERLHRLEEAGRDVAVIRLLERVVNQYGLVEFRPALATVVDRLESRSFEIAMFGRVSSGKSSLLNHIIGQDILPVGVTPITAVPTRIVHGPEARITVWLADRNPEHLSIDRLAEFVTEQRNPSNRQHVTRILVELPSSALRESVVYVDTPGLGSLATSGAAETKAYLPRCDLGIVLIDCGSTLTEEDLATVRSLYESGIPASIVLSKADVLEPSDRERAIQYVEEHIRTDLGLALSVHAVSIREGYLDLLEQWLGMEILPLFERHADLARQSVKRKIGALRLGVEAALRARVNRHDASKAVPPVRLGELERDLRNAAGRIAEARSACVDLTDLLRQSGDDLIQTATERLAEAAASADCEGAIKMHLEQAAAESVCAIASKIREVSFNAGQVLATVATTLGLKNRPEPEELSCLLGDMPRFDLGTVVFKTGRIGGSIFGRGWAIGRLRREIRAQIGSQVDESIAVYARVIQSWVREIFTELQERFDAYADAYRAQLGRLASSISESVDDEQAIRDDLAALEIVTLVDAPGAVA